MQCATHPAVPAIGLCVACGSGVCASCSTRLQGRNFCVRCLAKRAHSEAVDSAPVASTTLRFVVALSALASAVVLLSAVTGFGFLLYMMG